MRKLLMYLVVLLTFILCSCTKASPEKMSTEKKSTETKSTAKVIDKEDVSIEFMGEKITPPKSYPDVPDVYTPVLDDLYLYGELLHRYETLNHEGKVTPEIMKECEEVQEKIKERGYIDYPYGGIQGTSGYALADLDGDGSPELLLLDNSGTSYSKQIPSIYSIFTIRNGKLVCIAKDSYELKDNTILAADGTFYQSAEGGNAGYTWFYYCSYWCEYFNDFIAVFL